MDYRHRHVVITGGTGALGTAVVAALIESGASCHIPFIVAAEAERFSFRDHQKVKLLPVMTLADEAEVARLYDGVPQLWASIHLAGGFAMAPLRETRKSDLMQQLEMNFISAFLCCRAAVNTMTRGRMGGRIVNTAARPALEWRTGAGMTAYAASKAAVAAFTAALAEEVANTGILVNAIAPSIMNTPANRAAMPEADHAAWPKVEEVAATIVFLAGPANKVTRGAIVPVYGRS